MHGSACTPGKSCCDVMVGLLFPALFLTFAQAAKAEECAYVARNFRAYKEQCLATDQCRAEPRFREMLRTCTGDRSALDPAPSAAQPALSPLPDINSRMAAPVPPTSNPEDCQQLVRKLKNLQAGGMDLDGIARRRILAERACGHPIPLEKETSCQSPLITRVDILAAWSARLQASDQALQSGIQDLTDLKQELLDQGKWVGQARELTAYVLKALDTSGKLVLNTLLIAPGGSEMVNAAKATSVAGNRFLLLVKSGKAIQNIIKDDLEALWVEAVLDMGASRNPIAATTRTLYTLTKDLSELQALPAKFKAARAEIARQVDLLDRQVTQARKKLLSNRQAQARVEAYAASVEAELAAACPQQPRLP